MNQDVNFAYPDEDYREVERMFHELAPSAVDEFGEASQYARLFQHLVPRIRESAEKDQLSGVGYDDRLREAEKVVDDLAGALQAHVGEREPGAIRSAPTLDELRFRDRESHPNNWSEASPVDKSLLDKATAAYLERPWMQLNYLDWCILNGYIFDELARLGLDMKSARAYGPVDWAYLFAGGDGAKQIFWRTVFGVSKFLIRWLVMPSAIAAIYYLESREIGAWMAALYTIYLVIHLAVSPTGGANRNALIRFIERRKRLDDLMKIYRNSSVDVIHPSRLHGLISRAETHKAFFRPAVFSILDRAIARDETALAIEDVEDAS